MDYFFKSALIFFHICFKNI